MRKKKSKFQKFMKKHFPNFKVYWYALDSEIGLLREKLGVHFFYKGFEMSFIWYNLIITWAEE